MRGKLIQPHNIFYVTDQAPGALPNGTRVAKVGTQDGDTHRDGAPGTVIGSIGPADLPKHPGIRYGYFVRFDDAPQFPAFISSNRIKEIKGD